MKREKKHTVTVDRVFIENGLRVIKKVTLAVKGRAIEPEKMPHKISSKGAGRAKGYTATAKGARNADTRAHSRPRQH